MEISTHAVNRFKSNISKGLKQKVEGYIAIDKLNGRVFQIQLLINFSHIFRIISTK